MAACKTARQKPEKVVQKILESMQWQDQLNVQQALVVFNLVPDDHHANLLAYEKTEKRLLGF